MYNLTPNQGPDTPQVTRSISNRPPPDHPIFKFIGHCVTGAVVLAIAFGFYNTFYNQGHHHQSPTIPSGIYQGAGMPTDIRLAYLKAESTKTHSGSKPEPVLCLQMTAAWNSKTLCYTMDEWVLETPYRPAYARFSAQIYGTYFWVPEDDNRLSYRQGPGKADFYPREG